MQILEGRSKSNHRHPCRIGWRLPWTQRSDRRSADPPSVLVCFPRNWDCVFFSLRNQEHKNLREKKQRERFSFVQTNKWCVRFISVQHVLSHLNFTILALEAFHFFLFRNDCFVHIATLFLATSKLNMETDASNKFHNIKLPKIKWQYYYLPKKYALIKILFLVLSFVVIIFNFNISRGFF